MNIVKLAVLMNRICASFLGAVLVGTFSSAFASESPFGFIYTLDLQPANTWELEHRSWLQQGQSHGRYSYLINRTEMEYGVTDWYQVGFYVNSSYAYAFRNGVDGATSSAPGVYLSENFDTTQP
jgi:hypothetical protein